MPHTNRFEEIPATTRQRQVEGSVHFSVVSLLALQGGCLFIPGSTSGSGKRHICSGKVTGCLPHQKKRPTFRIGRYAALSEAGDASTGVATISRKEESIVTLT
ncbi:hypothetical protein CEXT_724161 [Caerostris extrusa]|uniref:Uncharacterized protein n=1 Tax=Caerostris extrusa TaxID=172846 RepID=A0AAV4PAI9_CAEEX|nr:hypothetical protein CEXT_724161 [Caerostris extrusa]